MQFLELKIPPPVVAVCTAVLMYLTEAPLDSTQTTAAARWAATAVLVCAGAAFDLSALWAFHRARTTINPMKPSATSSLVQDGVYRITRNPMYMGLLCLLCAWATYLGSPWTLIGPPAFVAYITRFQIQPEERVMADKFGADYLAYRTRVRRWI
jgi:protein-S-isoprenylcysteine O-methyltransferase Ste14